MSPRIEMWLICLNLPPLSLYCYLVMLVRWKQSLISLSTRSPLSTVYSTAAWSGSRSMSDLNSSPSHVQHTGEDPTVFLHSNLSDSEWNNELCVFIVFLGLLLYEEMCWNVELIFCLSLSLLDHQDGGQSDGLMDNNSFLAKICPTLISAVFTATCNKVVMGNNSDYYDFINCSSEVSVCVRTAYVHHTLTTYRDNCLHS